MSTAIAALSMDGVEKANSGHPGMPMGMSDTATVLFTRHLKYDAADPQWPDRDRFVLSAGHGSMLLYSLLYLLGVEGMELEDLKNFRQMGSKTAGHPEVGHAPGIETTTGPLGQGLGNAVGMALAEAHLRARYGSDVVDHYTYVIAGDGCLMEGISQESIGIAGHHKLNKLILFWDNNDITIDGHVSLSDSTKQIARFEASGWNTIDIDGHDHDAIDRAIIEAKKSDRPTLIACKTIIGRGAPNKGGTHDCHGAPLGKDELALAKEALGWPYGPFEVPDNVLDAWRKTGTNGVDAHKAWTERLGKSANKDGFETALKSDVTPAVTALKDLARTAIKEGKSVATRKASQMALDVINEAVSFTLGGSADLTPSNNTKAGGIEPMNPENYGGRYMHWGIREHGMASAMNGLALHGGIIPYGGTFLVFSDYARPAMRLAALMKTRVVYVMTHDSIGLGEDGPTHQPVEHVASLRAIPDMWVFRPADTVETAEAWSLALQRTDGPSTMALTRQNLPVLRTSAEDNLTAKGGYVLREAADADVTLMASGSEVEIAVDAMALLAEEGIKARVVSVPCMDLFEDQDPAYIEGVLGKAPRLALEAGIRQGWDKLLFAFGGRGDFMGVETFGASGPYKEVYEHFGLTPANAVAKAKALMGRK
ncbi:transketolase [Parvularcula sp. LCG005]|uniref:transketolase n=1 Tax=Parvularcula sp. LCG005 TaxID=3078805 RepID=UPI00294392B9|nr:transketolase [Parvularcula sp. LCG005]WOI54822.1 transketolase [Parvularcula sp. LCG005]